MIHFEDNHESATQLHFDKKMHEYHEKSTSVIDVSEAKVTLNSSLYIMPLVELQINRLDLIMNKSSMSEFH